MKKEKNLNLFILISIILGALIILGAIFLFINLNKGQQVSENLKTGENNKYKAVFLINSQVYFGKIKQQTDKNLVLENVYYIQVNQANKEKDSEPQMSLVKLGEEMHDPENLLEINYQNVLFIETLKDDSRIITAISDYEKNKQENNSKVE